FRLRQTLAAPNHTIQPFDQDRWAAAYDAYDAATALATFTTIREWNLRFLHSLPKEAFATPVTHPERGAMTLQTVVETMGGHDLNHVKQIAAIAGRRAAAS